jgi:SPP1 gp7 family putative phage head morphogenesis protein
LKFAQSTNATTNKSLNDALDQLREELAGGLFSGDSIPEMRKRVQSIFESMDKSRATLIAQSETQRAVHEGLRIAAKESGVVKGFEFLLSDDACPICKKYEGKVIGLDDKFNEDDTYDDSMLPIHPGCRCTVTEVLKDAGEE